MARERTAKPIGRSSSKRIVRSFKAAIAKGGTPFEFVQSSETQSSLTDRMRSMRFVRNNIAIDRKVHGRSEKLPEPKFKPAMSIMPISTAIGLRLSNRAARDLLKPVLNRFR
jgi:hypothetical protein